MRHQQVLDKLAARGHVRALDEDLARQVAHQMSYPGCSHEDVARAVIPPILARWRCLLESEEARPATKDVVRVALATLLHKYGFQDPAITAEAIAAVDALNDAVVLSDAFERQSADIKKLLRTAPTPLSRRPGSPRSVTFLRVGDVLSIELRGHFQAAYVRQVTGLNETPVIEFYAGAFTRPPELADLAGREAARPGGRARFSVDGLTYLPDPAHQVRAVAAAHGEGPHGGEPGPSQGLHTITDILTLQRHMDELIA
ncbi:MULTISPECIES: hypothetical protein [unclassified Streptomyces]|uniref:hypothetical protein n=1 Tax=unclassified Streptomyces TaxID=2593676 RepID=UPI002270F9C9|nr:MULTISPECIES: hypothetical protein [unclassified Streptomyces]MCY0922283.1 hypothetical protein [Streptomyces sp. H27-G5]MCY0957917.1 hypothetical protein [Streptomyces sp. H27-H5]